MDDLAAIVRRYQADNKAGRERGNTLAARTVEAIGSGDSAAIADIVRDARQAVETDAGSDRQETGTAGTVDGSDRASSTGSTRERNSEKQRSGVSGGPVETLGQPERIDV